METWQCFCRYECSWQHCPALSCRVLTPATAPQMLTSKDARINELMQENKALKQQLYSAGLAMTATMREHRAQIMRM